MSLDDRQKAFVRHLLNLAAEGKEDRGALADLRSGLGKSPGEMARVHKHVVPFLPDKPYYDRWYYTLASLFGSFPKHKKGYSIGKAFGLQKSDSNEARFVALLNAHPDDLPDHLRHIISLLKANEQPVDWFALLGDLLQWDNPNRPVQLKWARDFYYYAAGAGPTSTTPESDVNNSTTQQEDNDNG